MDEELDVLRSIYLDELSVESGEKTLISIRIYANSSCHSKEENMAITVCLEVAADYPNSSPTCIIRNPRGISELFIADLMSELENMTQERIGFPILFDIIQYVQDRLLEIEAPQGLCPVCLYEFAPADVFYKTECDHFFHLCCLLDYAVYQEKQSQDLLESRVPIPGEEHKDDPLLCPCCRMEISRVFLQETSCELDAPRPYYELVDDTQQVENTDYVITSQTRFSAVDFSELWEKQRKKGGLIGFEPDLLEPSSVELYESDDIIDTVLALSVLDVASDATQQNGCDSSATPQMLPEKSSDNRSFNNAHRNGFCRPNNTKMWHNDKPQHSRNQNSLRNPSRCGHADNSRESWGPREYNNNSRRFFDSRSWQNRLGNNCNDGYNRSTVTRNFTSSSAQSNYGNSRTQNGFTRCQQSAGDGTYNRGTHQSGGMHANTRDSYYYRNNHSSNTSQYYDNRYRQQRPQSHSQFGSSSRGGYTRNKGVYTPEEKRLSKQPAEAAADPQPIINYSKETISKSNDENIAVPH